MEVVPADMVDSAVVVGGPRQTSMAVELCRPKQTNKERMPA
jgi:hypothetical protein